jgi:hypothetical protein
MTEFTDVSEVLAASDIRGISQNVGKLLRDYAAQHSRGHLSFRFTVH